MVTFLKRGDEANTDKGQTKQPNDLSEKSDNLLLVVDGNKPVNLFSDQVHPFRCLTMFG